MQRTYASTIESIKQMPEGVRDEIGDIIWDYYYQGDLRQQIQENHQKTIDEFKDIIKSVSNNIDYRNFVKNKNHIKNALEKKKHPVNQCIGSVFHPQHKKYRSHTHYGGTHLNSLDIFVGDMEEQFLVFTLGYKDRLLIRLECQHVWKNTPKRNFIIKYLLYTYSQEYWMDNTCNGILKSGTRCGCYLKPNCLHIRCSRHKFSQVKV